MVVVDDGPDELVAVRVPGSVWTAAAGYPGFERQVEGLTTGEWEMDQYPWERTYALSRVRPGRPYNLIQFLDAETAAFVCWYVNFERPALRHRDGRSYDTLDLMLDLVVLPTRKTIWKDTDHWTWACGSGVFTEHDIACVEAVRAEIAASAEAGQGDFDGTWTTWSPPDKLTPPTLPADWNRTTPGA
ncbi:MAG: DUF402 domain-containing protein [Microthrixaceae bacterium]